MPDIFDEVESDLRSERMRAQLLHYGKFVGAAAVVVVIGILVWQGLMWRERRNQQHVANAYYAALEAAGAPSTTPTKASAGQAPAGQAKAAADFARLSGANTPVGYRTLARLHAAALAAKGGNHALALKLWQEIVEDKAADPLYRGLARLLWATHQIATLTPGSDATKLTAELAPILVPDNPWRPMAEEASALIALARGDEKAAHKALTALANDPTAPGGLHARATALLARLSP